MKHAQGFPENTRDTRIHLVTFSFADARAYKYKRARRYTVWSAANGWTRHLRLVERPLELAAGHRLDVGQGYLLRGVACGIRGLGGRSVYPPEQTIAVGPQPT